jgi:vacuolar-type H+-ATPase subunit I/STV1
MGPCRRVGLETSFPVNLHVLSMIGVVLFLGYCLFTLLLVTVVAFLHSLRITVVVLSTLLSFCDFALTF